MKIQPMPKKQTPAKITSAFIYIMISAYLLFPGLGGFQVIMQWKFIAFSCICGLYCMLMIISSAKDIPQNIKNINITQGFVLAYLVLTFVSSIKSPYSYFTIIGMSRYEGLLTIALYCICFLFISTYWQPSKNLLNVFCVAVIAFNIIAYLQFLGFNPLWLYPSGYNYFDANVYYSGQYVGTIGNVDLVAAFIAPCAAALLVAIYRIEGRQQILCAISSISCIITLLIIWVKSGLLGFFAGLIICAPFVLRIDKSKRKKIIIVLIALLIIFMLFVYAIDVHKGMFHELHQIMHGNANPNYGTGRIRIWTAVFEKIKERPIFGFGPDTMLAAKFDPWVNHIVDSDTPVYAYIDVAHNEYLNVLFHQGIFSLLAFLGAIISSLVTAIKNINANRYAILFSFIVVYSIQAFFNISMCITAIYFWIALGIITAKQ